MENLSKTYTYISTEEFELRIKRHEAMKRLVSFCLIVILVLVISVLLVMYRMVQEGLL